VRANLAEKTVEFCARLRTEHGFAIGPRESREALLAMEVVGVADRMRVAAALRAICCSRSEEIELFDRAFDFFFSSRPQGARQTRGPRRLREVREERDAPAAAEAPTAQRRPERESAAEAWQTLLARYSPDAATGDSPTIPREGLDAARRDAARLVTRLHLGRSLHWRPQPHGRRFDLRRTLRAALRTGGELLAPRALGHPLRNPRFVLLLDGSRSMHEHAPRMLQFAYALCQRSRRTAAFLFSTQLRDVTRRLRDADRASLRLSDLGEAWGGGTRIGASLRDFVRRHGASLTDQTFLIVVSDGLDAGEIEPLQWAMRELDRRCFAVAWINPHANLPGYAPSARGMQAALPYVSAFTSFERLDALTRA